MGRALKYAWGRRLFWSKKPKSCQQNPEQWAPRVSGAPVLLLDLVPLDDFDVSCLRGHASVVPRQRSRHAVDQEEALLLAGAARREASRVVPDVLGVLGPRRTPEEISRVGADVDADDILILSAGCWEQNRAVYIQG